MDERVEKLEATVQTLSDQFNELFAQLSNRLEVLNASPARNKGEISASQTVEAAHSNTTSRSTTAYAPKIVKLDFPRFIESEDPMSWLCRAEQFFGYHRTPEEERVSLASFHLTGNAQLWFQLLIQDFPTISWQEFREEILQRFGPNSFVDFFGELTKLQQDGSVQDYQARFEKLLAKIGRLEVSRQVSCFISGLSEGIKADVQASRPNTLSSAIGLAKLFEARNSKASAFEVARSPPPAVQSLTVDEISERRRKGLCFRCNENYAPGHRCKRLFSIQAVLDGSVGEDDMDLEEDSVEQAPKIRNFSDHG